MLHDIRGELQAACDGYGRARQLFAELGFARSAAVAQLNLGRCFMKLGTLPEALATLLGALHSAEPLSAASGLQADALREIGWWHRLERQPEKALVYLRRALELVPEAAGTLDRLGTVHADLGELATARRFYAQALEKVRGIALEEAHVRANLCRLEELAGRDAEGLEQCRKALPVFTRLGATGTAAQVLLLSARLERRRQRLRAAEALAERALLLVESQRPLAGDTRLRSAFLAERLDVYETLIDLRMELRTREPAAGWEARALQVSELTRARSLLDLLGAERVDAARRVDPLLRRAEQELLARIDGRARNLAARSLDQGQPEAGAEMELAALEEQLAALRQKLRRVAPSYAALSQPQPPDIPEIQALLDDDTVLVVYHLGERASYLWRVDRAQLEGYRLVANRSLLEHLAESWYSLLADPGQRWATGDPERRRARQLSARLLGPIAAELPRWRRLLIVADGALQRIPFAALPSPVDAARGRPLIVDHEIVTAPSVAVLGVLRRLTAGRRAADGFPRRGTNGGLLAVVADPVYERSDDRLPNPAPPGSLPAPRYRRLPSAAEEARDLLALAAGEPTLLLAGFEARRDRVMAGALEGFRIGHFATHAQTEATPGRPLGLVLSRFDERGRPVEGILGLQELYGLHLPAELVVLSACGTALGEEIRGEGLLGLSRGFMHAGTPRVVVSLWAVRDRATRELMGRFYQALLRDRTSPAEALRRTQASMWRDGWPIHDWAAFVLQGDWRSFPVNAELGGTFFSSNANKGGGIVSGDSEPRELPESPRSDPLTLILRKGQVDDRTSHQPANRPLVR
ncbi:MAG: CHAT domain-containing protein [bacterium]|nr:CHAT domain-containing protein [bacterium]